MNFTAEELLPVIKLIAKNVVKVNDGQTKNVVSRTAPPPSVVLNLHHTLGSIMIPYLCFSGCQEQICVCQDDEDFDHCTAQIIAHHKLGNQMIIFL